MLESNREGSDCKDKSEDLPLITTIATRESLREKETSARNKHYELKKQDIYCACVIVMYNDEDNSAKDSCARKEEKQPYD